MKVTDKYKWVMDELKNVSFTEKARAMKHFLLGEKKFLPKKKTHADMDLVIKCALCPNMCRFDCGTLQAGKSETLSPAYKARIGYFLSKGIIDPTQEENREYIDLMYKCTNEESCKVWCPFEFSVVTYCIISSHK